MQLDRILKLGIHNSFHNKLISIMYAVRSNEFQEKRKLNLKYYLQCALRNA